MTFRLKITAIMVFSVLALALPLQVVANEDVFAPVREDKGEEHHVSATAVDRKALVFRVDVLVEEGGDKHEKLASLARNLIVLKSGAPYSNEKLQQSIESLKRSRLFRVIDVPDPVETKEGLVVTFDLTAYYRIRDIRISGAFPLLERKLITTMSIYVGEAFVPSVLKNQEKRIRELYMKEGYPEPEVQVTADLGDVEKGVVVNVRIDKGRFYSIRTCEIKGDKAFFGIRLKLRTHVYKSSFFFGEGRRLIREKLDEDIANLTRFYRTRGYPEVKITVETDIDEKKKWADVRFVIDEGPYYEIRFKGNEAFWSSTLKKSLDFSSRGNVGDVTLKRGLRSIREKYHQAGYPDVWVTMKSETVTKKRGRKVRIVVIEVEEGFRSMVAGLEFSGNRTFDRETLMKDVLSRPSGLMSSGAFLQQTLSEDVQAVAAFYRKNGFSNVKVTDQVEWTTERENRIRLARIVIHVDEGAKFTLGSVRFSGLQGLNHKDALALLSQKKGGLYSSEGVAEDEKKLSAAISEKGYPHVTVKGKVHVSDQPDQADLVYEVNEGPYVEVGKIVYYGNFITDEKIFNRETELKEGDYFSLTKYLEAQRNMRDINALNSVEFKEFGLKEKEGRVDILASVEEKKPYYFQAALGYDTTQNRYVNAKLGDRNLFGLNKEAWVSQEVSDIGYRSEAGVTEPRFLGTRIASTMNVYAEKIEELNTDFGTMTYGSSINLSREFTNNVTLALAFSYQFKDQYQKDPGDVGQQEDDAFDGRHMFITSPSISYNSTDSFIRPRKGLYTIFSVDFSNALGDAPDDFLKYQAQARYYYSPLSFLTLALRARYGYLEPIAVNADIPNDQLFYLGGATDVRGFDENLLRFDSEGDPVGGREFYTGSLEARIDVGMNFEITCFYDTGKVGKTNSDEGDEGFRSSLGTGLRYVTPIGPVGFLYGWKTSPKENEARGNLHFTIGYSF